VDSIISQVSKKVNIDAEKIYEKVVWPLGKKYGHAYEAFKVAIT
jgi:translation initiation factor 2 subunit 1